MEVNMEKFIKNLERKKCKRALEKFMGKTDRWPTQITGHGVRFHLHGGLEWLGNAIHLFECAARVELRLPIRQLWICQQNFFRWNDIGVVFGEIAPQTPLEVGFISLVNTLSRTKHWLYFQNDYRTRGPGYFRTKRFFVAYSGHSFTSMW